MKILNNTIAAISPQSNTWRERARERLDQLTMPHWALGRIMDLAVDLAGMTRSLQPATRHKVIVVMAADHGVVAEGVTQYPQDVTWQMVTNFVDEGAGINALAGQVGADVRVVDMGVAGNLEDFARTEAILSLPVAPGTANMAKGPAMTREQAILSVENGIRVARRMIDENYDLIGVGEMGIGNTTPSSAIIATLSGESVEAVTGHGTGIDEERRQHKIAVIEKALRINHADPQDGLDVLAKLGGFEIGGIAGVILGAAAGQRPVLVDGLISSAGALIARQLAPNVADYLIAAHRGVERGHGIALAQLGKEPLLDLQLRLGEGTGAALAMNLVEAAGRVLQEVKTFAKARVSSQVQ
uniref:Nicotinate-nucleotide--dimethylbenzimidazole phosphoribosyltransferase n=1 Tax=Candidatus Kentrum sp. MB TaxID=2138164 RepID=A0A450XLJ8_9GAMM|nr:MAG: nicotinate-nucleotide-dimethylbenzimidazole phosphoribosyltransferase [Candidatus Kentron sp. MB]VFK34166.1 MAG: nicotinate-nucleotide-dimethylbenzimidazole phosphoribosyltransferase [Candidatus Kentron sp. MB]VFK76731.1 MAG: nicotinate-nucleotide-dimethylbenzimidazole phosphoribosyltransferase [Candidatus Kentron sp. MB]